MIRKHGNVNRTDFTKLPRTSSTISERQMLRTNFTKSKCSRTLQGSSAHKGILGCATSTLKVTDDLNDVKNALPFFSFAMDILFSILKEGCADKRFLETFGSQRMKRTKAGRKTMQDIHWSDEWDALMSLKECFQKHEVRTSLDILIKVRDNLVHGDANVIKQLRTPWLTAK